MTRLPLARLAALAALLSPLAAHAQDALPADQALRPYARLAVGAAALPNRLDFGAREVVQNAFGATGAVEAGVQRGALSLGVEIAGTRSRAGSAADLNGALPSADYYDATQLSAVAVLRRHFEAGPIAFSVGAGAGAGYASSVVQTVARTGTIGPDGRLSGTVGTNRESSVRPLLHLDTMVGHNFGATFVGLGYTADGAVFGSEAYQTSRASFTLELRRTF